MNADLLKDLAQYKHYRERSVMMAASSLITVYKQTMPSLLHKKYRGRPTEATISLDTLKYGEIAANDFVPGAEVLLNNDCNDILEIDSENSEVCKLTCNHTYNLSDCIFNYDNYSYLHYLDKVLFFCRMRINGLMYKMIMRKLIKKIGLQTMKLMYLLMIIVQMMKIISKMKKM